MKWAEALNRYEGNPKVESHKTYSGRQGSNPSGPAISLIESFSPDGTHRNEFDGIWICLVEFERLNLIKLDRIRKGQGHSQLVKPLRSLKELK